MKASSVTLGAIAPLAIFLGAMAIDSWALAAKPAPQAGPSIDSAELWTREPRRVNVAAQNFERLPARGVPIDADASSKPQAVATDVAMSDSASGSVDATATASVQAAASDEQPTVSPGLNAAHVEWCASRYRSYRPADDSYAPFSGGRRPCVSPASDAAAADRATPDTGTYVAVVAGTSSPLLHHVAADAATSREISSDHARDCFSRYRSYRRQDNSYQPFGGGPRRQCE